MSKTAKVRLFVDLPLIEGQPVTFAEEQSRYLVSVMRLTVNDEVLVFNGRDGEFAAVLTAVGKKNVQAEVCRQTRPFAAGEDIWLLFAPVKKDRTDYIIEKATELGVKKIIPVITRHTITDRVRTERFAAQAAEAAEQSRRLDVPQIGEAIRLETLLSGWEPDRRLFFMDESGRGLPARQAFAAYRGASAVLVGPEGGFSDEELADLRSKPFAVAVSLGPLILRAETAVAASLSLWQAVGGHWDGEEK